MGLTRVLKYILIYSHLDCFHENLGTVTDAHWEMLHEDISVMKERYRGRWDDFMMADNCWTIRREKPTALHSRVSKKQKIVPWTCSWVAVQFWVLAVVMKKIVLMKCDITNVVIDAWNCKSNVICTSKKYSSVYQYKFKHF